MCIRLFIVEKNKERHLCRSDIFGFLVNGSSPE